MVGIVGLLICNVFFRYNFFCVAEIFFTSGLLEASLSTYHLPNLLFPPPLILSVRGDVKLFDFGLARGKG